MAANTANKKSTNSGRKRVHFQIQARPGSCIFVSGSFNNWNGTEKRMKDADGDGRFAISLLLPRGKHEYKFVIDGEWRIDPKCPTWVRNEHGTLNSVITVE